MSNTYTVKGVSYFFEVSRTEHLDGAITGSIMRMIPAAPGDTRTFAQRSGNFRIEPEGKVSRGPAFLKRAANAG
jgi:hypothetical protein